ncbi:hypothetical protein [Parasphingorhabdus sp.]|uniref:hypothetical protein n=1 Tax=Parasphingorhabdus sp. TaxID=2709688 RepID=UPI002F9388CC
MQSVYLLIQRASVLLIRPITVLAEGKFVPGGNILIFLLPIAAMALTISSIPVHLQFFRSTATHAERKSIESTYISGLLIISLLAVVLLIAALMIAWKDMSLTMLLSICAVFLIEKFSDELTRYFEFHRQYHHWFGVQLLRSAWLFIPIGLYLAGYNYAASLAILAVLIAIGSVTAFFVSTKLRPSFNMNGWHLIKTNIAFISSAGLVAIHRQVPRIAVASLFPQFAHIFQAIAQLMQGVSLLFNVKYQIPYRAMIARRPLYFERLFHPIFRTFSFIAIILGFSGIAISILAPSVLDYQIAIILGLGVAMTADSLGFSLATIYLGYLPWLLEPKQALMTYGYTAMVLLICFLIGYGILMVANNALIVVPATTIAVSLLWVTLIRHKHFKAIG